jgi:hypothetical protein
VLVGGENLLDKADAQRRLLEQAAGELELRRLNEIRLQHHLQLKEVRPGQSRFEFGTGLYGLHGPGLSSGTGLYGIINTYIPLTV